MRDRTDTDKELSYAETVRETLCALYGPLRNAAKTLAQMADAHPSTAKNWLRGVCAPNGQQLAALMAADPDVEDAFLAFVRARRRNAEVKRIRVRAGNAALRASLAGGGGPDTRGDGVPSIERRGQGVADRKTTLMAVALRSVGE